MSSFSAAAARERAPAQNSNPSAPNRDPYRASILVLLAATSAGALAALAGGLLIGNLMLLDVAATLGISSGVLFGVAVAQKERRTPSPCSTEEPLTGDILKLKRWRLDLVLKALRRLRNLIDTDRITRVKVVAGAAGFGGIAFVLLFNVSTTVPSPLVAAVLAAACFLAAGLSATAVRYLADLEPSLLPEALGLCRGARVIAWVLVLAGISMGFAWADQQTVLRVTQLSVLALDAVICSSLIERTRRTGGPVQAVSVFPVDFRVVSILGSRANIVASVLDAGEQQLGIDLRSTWALTVVRRSLEPLVIGLCLAGWLTTSLTAIAPEEQGLVERLGVPVAGEPLSPGLHLHWPWPVDQVFRVPVLRVQALTVGHEGQESGGPEDVLWARQHAANEYTLLLGNGRDLITIDAAVQFRISDAKAWRYHTQNPADALRAIAYRAVMRSTVNRTLSEALSENVVTLTQQMRSSVQKDADALGLGVEVMGFTVGGMHPPVAVAIDYQRVVSAELGKVTSVVSAQAYRNKTVPNAEAYVVAVGNGARAEGVQELGSAAGEAWAFRTLESQYRAAPQEYLFRRRLETLERGLFGRSYTIVDSRFQRDGGELWVIP
jgi:regulator of protease activity HflC (stomatin/prohibitin superfamily)